MTPLALRAWFALVALAVVMGLLLFLPAGTLRYWQAWMYLGQLGDRFAATGQRDRAREVFARIATSPDLSEEMRQGANGRLQELR